MEGRCIMHRVRPKILNKLAFIFDSAGGRNTTKRRHFYTPPQYLMTGTFTARVVFSIDKIVQPVIIVGIFRRSVDT